jgi:hypothetical protein
MNCTLLAEMHLARRVGADRNRDVLAPLPLDDLVDMFFGRVLALLPDRRSTLTTPCRSARYHFRMLEAIAGLAVTFADFISAVTSWVVAKLRGQEDLFDQIGRDGSVDQSA